MNKKYFIALLLLMSMVSLISCGKDQVKEEVKNEIKLTEKQETLESEYVKNISDMLKDKEDGISTLRTATYNTSKSGDKYSIRDILLKGEVVNTEDSGEYFYVYLGDSKSYNSDSNNAVVCKFDNKGTDNKKNNSFNKGDIIIIRGTLSNTEAFKLEECIKINEENFDSEVDNYKVKLNNIKDLNNNNKILSLTDLVYDYTQDSELFMSKYEGQEVTVNGIAVYHEKNGFMLYLVPTDGFVVKNDNGIIDTSNCVAAIWDMKSKDLVKLDALKEKQNVTIKCIISKSQTIKKVYFSLTECTLIDENSATVESIPVDINPNGEIK